MSSTTVEAGTAQSPLWKREISARVQAHRSRRQAHSHAHEEELSSPRATPRLTGVAATVAERYAAAPSYSQYLAKLADTADDQQEPQTDEDYSPQSSPLFAEAANDFVTQGSSALDIAVMEAEPAPRARPVFPPELETERATPPNWRNGVVRALPVSHAEKFSEHAVVEPDLPIAPKLIEFPRQLVASRRARPRLAEGPLREGTSQAETGEQLRIFEVEPEQISRVPMAAQNSADSEAAAPAAEWHYIRLDAPLLSSAAPAFAHRAAQGESLFDVAPLRRRAMAASLDFGLVALGFLIFAAGFIAVASQPPSDWLALLTAAIIFLALHTGYQWLFFTLSDATPGMRYARIALCNFQDENPDASQRRSRILAASLAAAAMGLGYAWIWFDPERLGWADRISHTYQRCY